MARRRPASRPTSQATSQADVPAPQTDAATAVRQATDSWLARLAAARQRPLIAFYLQDNLALAHEQMLHLFEHLRRLGRAEGLDLWLYSRGGATEVPWKVVSLLREYADHVAVLIPYRAHSAATHIAMGAEEIVMGPMAELGPVDPSRSHPLLPAPAQGEGTLTISVEDLQHLMRFLDERLMPGALTPDAAATVTAALFDKVHPLAIGALEQSFALARQISEKVLRTHMGAADEDVRRISDAFASGFKSHTYPISRREAKDIGLNIVWPDPDVDEAMWGLYTAFTNVQITAQAQIEGQTVTSTAAGFLLSKAGTSVGLAFPRSGGRILQQWTSRWVLGRDRRSLRAGASASTSAAAGPVGEREAESSASSEQRIG